MQLKRYLPLTKGGSEDGGVTQIDNACFAYLKFAEAVAGFACLTQPFGCSEQSSASAALTFPE